MVLRRHSLPGLVTANGRTLICLGFVRSLIHIKPMVLQCTASRVWLPTHSLSNIGSIPESCKSAASSLTTARILLAFSPQSHRFNGIAPAYQRMASASRAST